MSHWTGSTPSPQLPRRGSATMYRIVAVLAATAVASGPARAFDASTAAAITDFAHRKTTETFSALSSSSVSPKAALADGTWSTVSSTDLPGWTQGFFPGLLWMIFDATGDPAWRARADTWTRALEAQKTNTTTHDLGFKMLTSFGPAYRATGNAYYRDVLLASATSLATRFRPVAGVVSCCDWNSAWKLPDVVDTMMNLELLLWGAANGGSSAWRDMALSHARVTARELVRADGSTFHVVDFDPVTGAVRFRGTYQGYSNGSTWSRGQAWAIYGFTMVYRYTGAPDMLEAARKVARYWLARTPPDGVPNWDFDAPSAVKDSSAAAAASSAFLELSALVPDPAEAAAYRDAALRALDTLSSPAYLSAGTASRSVLLHGVGDLPHNREVDVGLVYGDYYFLEAVLRHSPRPQMAWPAKVPFAAATRPLGKGSTGNRTIEFDVTPRTSPIDAVVGYADHSTSVTDYPALAMAVRMNPSGYFDVRNGSGWTAALPLAYRPGATYHVRILAEPASLRYSVWIRPPGGAEVRIASRSAFRAGAPPTDDVGKVVLRTLGADGDFVLERHRVATASGTAPIPAALRAVDVMDSGGEAPEPVATLDGASAGCGGGWSAGLLALAALGARRRPD
jgi:unsaturated chondroitin disaccharide hydrolase